jgi:dipeptidyl aminopeptidase/acylaminoacyl peptidase
MVASMGFAIYFCCMPSVGGVRARHSGRHQMLDSRHDLPVKIAFFSAWPNQAWLMLLRCLLQPSHVAAQWDGFRLGAGEVVTWNSVDGTPIEGILVKPADYDASRKYPLLVVIHGGPTGIDTPALSADRYYPIERFAAKGALILRPNYRGSAGYGEKFRSLNVRNLGLQRQPE